MISSVLSSLAVSWLASQALAIELTVSKTGGNSSSSLLYGIMFEVGPSHYSRAFANPRFRILTIRVRYMPHLHVRNRPDDTG